MWHRFSVSSARNYFMFSFAAAASLLGNASSFCSKNVLVSPTSAKYSELVEKLKEIEQLSGVKGLLGWDEMVMLSPGSATARNDQKSALSGVIYEKQTNSNLESLLKDLTKSDLSSLPTDYERAVIRDAVRDFELTSKKTKDMAVREAELEGRGYQVWVEARSESKFEKFAPVLQEIVNLKREIASVTHPSMGSYDANVDSFERGMSTKRLDEIFTAVKSDLIPLIKTICASDEKKNYITPEALKGGENWSIPKQKELCIEIAEAIGFDFTKGRLDVSVHPFTGGSHPTDVRITTRYSTDNWLQGIAGTVHEVGHALYEQGTYVRT